MFDVLGKGMVYRYIVLTLTVVLLKYIGKQKSEFMVPWNWYSQQVSYMIVHASKLKNFKNIDLRSLRTMTKNILFCD